MIMSPNPPSTSIGSEPRNSRNAFNTKPNQNPPTSTKSQNFLNPDFSEISRKPCSSKLISMSSLNIQNRPPIPNNYSQIRVRKQIRLIPKRRSKSPTLQPASSNKNTLPTKLSPESQNPSSNNDGSVPVEVSLKLPINRQLSMDMNISRDSSILGSRSPSPSISLRSSGSNYSNISHLTASSLPRRIFPQNYAQKERMDMAKLQSLEPAPVVFDANLQFVLGCKKQPIRQSFRPSPSHIDPQTASNYLTEKIQNFLKRTDHVSEEWGSLGSRTGRAHSIARSSSYASYRPDSQCDTIRLIENERWDRTTGKGHYSTRSRSATNILIKGYQMTRSLPPTSRSRHTSLARELSEDDDRTIREEDNDLDELSEITVDLAEERSSSHLASERLDAETAERLKLEKELLEQQAKVKGLQEATEKLEMELICAKSELNGISEDDDPDNDDSGGVYRLKYERVAKELEFTKRRLQSQHEYDLEQLIGLKKQLEKKLSDAYEQVEEQRQVVGQWKRKAQKLTHEMNDLRMLLEDQNGRNNVLEKKQRKFDLECQAMQEAVRQEKQAKDRLCRETDVLIAEKFTLEQTLADTRLELDLKEEKLASLQRELEEITFGGSTEEEVAQLRRSKMDMDRRIKEQEEELDEMAGQVQLLEQAKLRLEMALETMRKEARREAQQRDEELEEARGSAYKKIKALECQLETEHEERTMLLRQKHELDRRLASMEDQERVDRQAEEATTQKLKRDLRKTKALLKDAYAQLERFKADFPGRTLIRQLRNQLEDAESARTLAMKARQTAEAELAEVQAMLEESQRARIDAEDRATSSQRDRSELQAQIEENEDEMSELMKKYSATVKQLNTEQIAVSEYEFRISELETERNSLKDQVAELQQRLENVENMSDPSAAMLSKRLEIRTKELESRLELEQATRSRIEVQVNRHKEALEKVQNELSHSKMRERNAQDALKKAQKSLREIREECQMASNREQESITKRKDVEMKLETSESELAALRNDLRLALQRIADLQQAMEEGDDDDSESEESDSSDATLSDLEERLKPLQIKRTSMSTKTQETTNGVADGTETLVIREKKSENSPRITVTLPSTAAITENALSINNSLRNGDSYA